MCSLILHWALLNTALSVVCFGSSNLYWSTMSEILSFWNIVSTWTISAMQSGAAHGASTILKSADQLDAFDWAIGEVIGSLVNQWPTTVLRRSRDKQWFDTSCRRAYDAKLTTYRAWCRARSGDHWDRFVIARLRPRGSMVLQRSHIMNTPGILWSTPSLHISGGRHLKDRSLACSRLFLLSGRRRWFGVGTCWESHSWALSLTVSSVMSSSWLLCLVSLSIGAILWPSWLL